MEDEEVPSEDIEFVSGLYARKTSFAAPLEPTVREYVVLLEESAPRSASEYTGPPKRPQDVSTMPLSAGIDCIASKGGTDGFAREVFESAIVVLLDDITVGALFVSGQSPNEPAEIVPSEAFRGVVIAHPYQSGNEFNAAILHDGPVLDLCNNQLFVGRRLVWFDLKVAGRDIGRFLPFETDKLTEAPTANVSLLDPKAKATEARRQNGSRGGRPPIYDGDRLRKDILAYLSSGGSFLYWEAFIQWCCENTRPMRGKSPAKPHQYPDPHTIKELVDRHELWKIKGVPARPKKIAVKTK